MSDERLFHPALENLLYLIRCGVMNQKPDLARLEEINLGELYRWSRLHSLSALIYTALESAWKGNPPEDRVPKGWKEDRERAVRSSLLFSAERKALLDWCEEQGIWYLPLKGILMQEYYPRVGMREMADNDILIDPAFREQICQWFLKRGYTAAHMGQGVHDCYYKPPIFNFEMHTVLFDPKTFVQWQDYLEHIGERLLPLEGTKYGRRFSQEDFYLYMMAHLYKHFQYGGTGLRSLVDCWVFCRDRENHLDWEYLRTESEQMGLGDFITQIRALVYGLFEDVRPLTHEEKELLLYYFTSGTYGTNRHRLQNKVRTINGNGEEIPWGSKLHDLYRCIVPQREWLEQWCETYAPFFLRHPWLMPLAGAYRILYQCTHGAVKKGWNEIRTLWKL